MKTNHIDLLHYHSAQGAIASAAIIVVTIIAPAMLAVNVACIFADDPLPR